MVLQNYFKKLKKGRKIGWFISKFTKRWFVLDMIRGDFYYTENHSKANPDKIYKLKEIGDLEENPRSAERCDWKFPFIIYAIDRKYVLHAETSSIKNDWCAAIRWVIKKNQKPQIQSMKNGENKLNVSYDLSCQESEKEKAIKDQENNKEILIENQSKTYQIITTKIKNRPNIKTLKISSIIEKSKPASNKKQNWIEGENNKEDLENKMMIDNVVTKVKEVKEEEDDEARLTDRQSYHTTHNEIFSHPSTVIENFQSDHINFNQIYQDTRHRRAFVSTQRELYSDYKSGTFTNTQTFEDKDHVVDLEQPALSNIPAPSNIIKAKHFEFGQKILKPDSTNNQNKVNTTSSQHHRKAAEIIVDPALQLPPEILPPTYIKASAPLKETKPSLEQTDPNKEYISRLSNIKSVSGRSPNAIRRLRNTISLQKTENISLDLSANSFDSPNRSLLNNTQPNVSPKFEISTENIGGENNNSRLENQNSAPSTKKRLLKGKFIYKKSSQPSPTYKDVLVKNSSFQNEIDDTNNREKNLFNSNRQSSRSSSESRGESPSILDSKLNPPIREVSISKKKIKTLLVEPSTAKVRDSIINELYQPIKPITQVKPRLSSSFFSRQQSFNFETRKNEPTEESYIY